jgi:hypothetical protein
VCGVVGYGVGLLFGVTSVSEFVSCRLSLLWGVTDVCEVVGCKFNFYVEVKRCVELWAVNLINCG